MRPLLAPLLALLAGFALAGCSLGGTVASQAGDYNLAVEHAANTQLLRNVLRARDQLPLHFTTVPQIRGSLSIGLGQPGIGLPIGALAANGLNLGLSGSSSPSFDVSALDTQEFTRGLLEPLEPDLFRYYLERGYSEQMLLLLMFNSVRDPATGQRVLNDPRCWFERPDCPQPVAGAVIRNAFLTGGGRFEFQYYNVAIPVGPPLSRAQAADPALLVALGEGKLNLRPAPGGQFQLFREERRLAACRAQANNARPAAPIATAGAAAVAGPERCHLDDMVAMAPAGASQDRPGLQIHLRSVADIIRFLGLVLRVQQEAELPEEDHDRCLVFPLGSATPGSPGREACLFRLSRDPAEHLPAGVAFEVTFDGPAYRVPRFAEPPADGSRRGDYTTQVLALLTELVNLKKASSAIPATRAVQILR